MGSMHRYGAALVNAPGLVSVHTLEDAEQGVLAGLALWESEALNGPGLAVSTPSKCRPLGLRRGRMTSTSIESPYGVSSYDAGATAARDASLAGRRR